MNDAKEQTFFMNDVKEQKHQEMENTYIRHVPCWKTAREDSTKNWKVTREESSKI